MYIFLDSNNDFFNVKFMELQSGKQSLRLSSFKILGSSYSKIRVTPKRGTFVELNLYLKNKLHESEEVIKIRGL